MRRGVSVLLALAAATGAVAAETRSLLVSANAVARCYIQSTEEIRFGPLDPGQAANVTGRGSVTVACARGLDFRLAADRGRNADAAGVRRMAAPDGSLLPYALKADTIAGTGLGFAAPVRMAIEATVAGADFRDLPANTYTDVIRVYLER